MRNDPIGANGEAMPAITRRAVLATGAAAAVSAFPRAARSEGASDKIMALIEAHRAAFAAWYETLDPADELPRAYARDLNARMPLVPCDLGGAIGVDMGREYVREAIASAFAKSREVVETYRRMDPLLAEAMEATLRTREAQNQTLADRIFADEQKHRDKFGVDAAERAYAETNEAQEAALWNLCAHYCETLADERARAAYVFADKRVREMVLLEPGYCEALLQTAAGIPDDDAGEA